MMSFVLETRVRIEASLFPQAVLQPVGVSRSNGAFGDGVHHEFFSAAASSLFREPLVRV